jgi:hypothetical protein
MPDQSKNKRIEWLFIFALILAIYLIAAVITLG